MRPKFLVATICAVACMFCLADSAEAQPLGPGIFRGPVLQQPQYQQRHYQPQANYGGGQIWIVPGSGGEMRVSDQHGTRGAYVNPNNRGWYHHNPINRQKTEINFSRGGVGGHVQRGNVHVFFGPNGVYWNIGR